MKQFSQACENNKAPILVVLQRYLQSLQQQNALLRVLEIGSGTGQHAAYFSEQMPGVQWQPTDLPQSFVSINAWREAVDASNCMEPAELDLRNDNWLSYEADHVFTANTLHIVSLSLVERLIKGVAALLKSGGYLFIYGPFNYSGRFTSDSNAQFNDWLMQRDPDSGIRDFEHIEHAAMMSGLQLVEDNAMPANNRLLVFRKHPN